MEQRIINVILRWLWLLVLATVVAGLAAYWFGAQQPTDYEASARLIVGPGVDGLSPDLNDLRAGAQLMQTYSELATTRPVLQAVVDDVGLVTTPDILRRRVTVRTNDETQILSIIVRDEDPVRSAAIANSIANMLLRLSPSGGESPAALLIGQIRSQAGAIEENIQTIEARIVQLEESLQEATSAEEQQLYLDQLTEERTRLANSQSTLALLYDSLQNTPTNQVKIVEPAIVGAPLAQSLSLVVLIGAMAGLLLAGVSVLGYEYLDNSIKSADELGEAAGAPVMGTILLENVETRGAPDSLSVRTKPQSRTAEAYRRLGTRLPIFGNDRPLRSIVVSGLEENVGADEIMSNLAVVLAQTGSEVLLLDANLHHPTVHTQFQLEGERHGLTNLLSGQISQLQPISIHGVPGLRVLPSGPPSYDSFSALASPRTGELLKELEGKVDVLIIAAPPLLSFAESLFLASHADGVILVTRRGQSSYAKVEEAVTTLGSIEARLVGTVLTTQRRGIPLPVKRAWRAVVAATKKAGRGARGAAVALGRGSANGIRRVIAAARRGGVKAGEAGSSARRKLSLRQRLASLGHGLGRGAGGVRRTAARAATSVREFSRSNPLVSHLKRTTDPVSSDEQGSNGEGSGDPVEAPEDAEAERTVITS